MGEAKRRQQATNEVVLHTDEPIAGLETFRDLPRKTGHFDFVLSWTDANGTPSGKVVARQVTPANVEQAQQQFQDLLADRYKSECERVGFAIDHDEFMIKQTPVLADRVRELLCEVKTQDDLKLDKPAGLMAFCMAAWMVWTSASREVAINFDKLLTIQCIFTYHHGEFMPFVAADHGDRVQNITVH